MPFHVQASRDGVLEVRQRKHFASKASWFWCGIVVFFVVCPRRAAAFGFERDATQWKREGKQPIQFVVNFAHFPSTFTPEQYLVYIRKGLEPWSRVATADVPFAIASTVNEEDKTSPEEDGVNMIFWKPDFVPRDQFAGKAFPFSSECDILLAPKPPFTLIDVEAIIMHELGHCLGLAHSTAHSVMTKFQGLPALGTDDAIGVSLLYPREEESFERSTASLTGHVLRQGKPLMGAVLRVVDPKTQRIVVSGFSGLIDGQHRVSKGGRFELPGLPPGRYALHVEPMDAFAAADPKGYGAPVSVPPPTFQPMSVELPELSAGDTHDVGTLNLEEQ